MHNYAEQIDWEDFHYALEIARQGSFLKASNRLDVHHTTVSRRLDRLEKALKTQLFFRHTRGVELTSAGEEMMRLLLQIEEDFAQLGARLQGYDMALQGVLKITAVEPLFKTLMPYLNRFQIQYPEIYFDLIMEARGLSLSQGEADIAFRAGPWEDDSAVIPIKLGSIYFALYGTQDYLGHHPEPTHLQDLVRYRYVLLKTPPASFVWQIWLEKALGQLPVGLVLNQPSALLDAILAGFGVGFLPCHQAKSHPELTCIWPSQDDWKTDLHLLVHRDRYRAAKIQAFIRFVKELMVQELSSYFNYRE